MQLSGEHRLALLNNELPDELQTESTVAWQSSLQKAQADADRRCHQALHLDYDAELPITAHRSEIIDAIQSNQVVIVCGETGSGKSTQLPKFCWEAGLGRTGFIGHTQPRRLAARSIANRLAAELQSPVGQTVGFKMRFTDQVQRDTIIKLMTDGILLAELQRNPWLDDYDCLIIDEAHERSINIDLILAYLKRIIPQRPELRVVITSATIDAEKFADYFGTDDQPAPIFRVSGRTFPVEIRYRSPAENENAFLDAIDELYSEGDGDVLVFLPTEREIRFAERTLRGHLTASQRIHRTDVLPLFARMNEADQQKIFQPGSRQRIILATNVAESSITVPSVRYVIDFGQVRLSRYAPRSKVQRLPVEAISQASANQRAGRCGRVADGICIRLYDEQDFNGRSAFTTPEIRRANLANVLLQVKLVGFAGLGELDWIEPPLPDSVRDAQATLVELNAIDEDGRLTTIGRQLGRWPVDPRVAKILLTASDNRCLADCLIIAAALEIQDPRLRPPEQQAAADDAHQKFQHDGSDFGSILLLWDFYQHLRQSVSRSKLERIIRQTFLSPARFREWSDVHQQLSKLTEAQKMRVGQRRWIPAPSAVKKPDAQSSRSPKNAPSSETKVSYSGDESYAAVHQSLLSGLLSGIAMRREDGRYDAAGKLEVQLWPGSGVRQSKFRWIVAAEIVETSQRYARTVAEIDNRWIESLASHLIKHSYDGPHFSTKAGRAMIHRKSSLFALPVLPADRVPLADVNPTLARELLIDQGLALGQLQSRARFYAHNRKVIDELAELANRSRDKGLLLDEYFLQQFYHPRIPLQVVDRQSLETWDRTLNPDETSETSPFLNLNQWLAKHSQGSLSEMFPDTIRVGTATVPVSYRFAPGDQADGVTAFVPESAIGKISEDQIGWLVPGLLRERVMGLIKSLPKRLRRNLTPAPETSDAVARRLLEAGFAESSFWQSLCKILTELSGERISVSDFDQSKLPEHLKLNFAIVDEAGSVTKLSRDLDSLIKTADKAIQAPAGKTMDDKLLREQAWFASKLTAFTIDALPEQVVTPERDATVTLFPTFVDCKTHVDVALCEDAELADFDLRSGCIRLYSISFQRELKSQIRHLPGLADAAMRLGRRVARADLEQQLGEFMIRIALVEGRPTIRTASDFESRKADAIQRISMVAADLGRWLPKLADAFQKLALARESHKFPSELLIDIDGQLDLLFKPGFMRHYAWQWLAEYPRYLMAIQHRLQKFGTGGQVADRRAAETVDPYQRLLTQRLSGEPLPRLGRQPLQQIRGFAADTLAEFQWMLEELRVSLFAQQLGTSVSVSPKRLDKIRERLER